MDKTNAMLYEAKIHADENRSKEIRQFSASVVEAVEELQGQLHDAEESLKAVERALDDVDYRGTYADGVMELKQQLAAALAACEAKDAAIEYLWAIIDDIDTYGDMAKSDDKAFRTLVERRQKDRWKTGIITDGFTLNIPIQPDASILKAHDEALIERCAEVCEEYQGSAETCASAIRELKSQL